MSSTYTEWTAPRQLGQQHGTAAHHAGIPAAPALDPTVINTIDQLDTPDKLSYLSAWLRAWHHANLKENN